MSTIAQLEPPRTGELEHALVEIGPADGPSPAGSSLRSLVTELAHSPLPVDPHAVERLRQAARRALAQLPCDHPLAGASVGDAGTPLLVRLVVRLADDIGDVALTISEQV